MSNGPLHGCLLSCSKVGQVHWRFPRRQGEQDYSSSSPRSLRRSSRISGSGPAQPTARPSRGTRCRLLGNGSSPRNHTAFSARRDRSPDLALPLAAGSAEVRPAAGGQRSGRAGRRISGGLASWPAVRRRARPKRKFLSPNGVAGEEPAHEARESSRAAAEEDVGMVREERPGVDIRVGRQGHVAKPRPPRPWALATLHWPVGDATSGSRNRIPRRRSRTLRRPDSGPAH
jgi:hypothetical protein